MAKEFPKLLVADKRGKIYDVPHLGATGMKAGRHFRLGVSDLIEIHPDSELFTLPGRDPVGFDPEKGGFVELGNEFIGGKKWPCSPVAVFLAPGYTATFSASYRERKKTVLLPLFSYAAAAFYKGRLFAAGVRVDLERRQALSGMDTDMIRRRVKEFRKIFPVNRLVRHLERCALTYCCPAARNFFLTRYEAPLPTSPHCNARCIGCISYQPGRKCPVTQPRIIFVPTPEEVAEVAVFHIKNVPDPVVSFGQGCEGEPLMVGKVLIDSVRLIRSKTRKGIINLNTNASKPDVIDRLFGEGLDSIRVSMNSVQDKAYTRYYRPKGYSFKDVVSSIRTAKRAGGFVSVNYLVMPGLTDSAAETDSLRRFLDRTGVDMIQWRNMNYDPLAYFRELDIKVDFSSMRGVRGAIRMVKEEYPGVMHGYFNPSRNRMRRHKSKFSETQK
jgi:wyosine [tRNA(Phe)-imidazoG37] synthetase (radical SAM superfamily)